MVLAPGQPIPHGQPYRYHLNGLVYMLTTRKRVGPLHTHRLAVRYSVDYYSSDHFTLDDSSRDSSSSSSSKTSSDSPSDDLSDHSLPTPSSGIRPSHHVCSLVPSIPRSFVAILDRPSHDSSSASPSRKRSGSPTRSVSLSLPISKAFSYARADLLPSFKRVRSSEFATDLKDSSAERFNPSRSRGTELKMDVDVVRRIDDRVVVEAVKRDEVEMGVRGLVEVRVDRVTHPVIADDIPEPAQEEGAVEVTNETTMPNTRSGATMTREVVNEQIDHRLIGALGARDAARNLEPLMEMEEMKIKEMETKEMKMEEMKMEKMEMPLNFNGAEGVFRLTYWFEKMETVFYISNCSKKYQVKYATCTLLNSALTWWNSHKRMIGIEAAYAMSWAELMKLMTEVCCLRNEVQKMETELWNLAVKGNDLTAYTRRFQELVLLCTRMVPNEEDKVERFIGGLPNNIQGNVIAAEPTKLQDVIQNNPRDNHRQQLVFKRQNVGGQNVARSYTAGNNKKKGDCKVTVTLNTQRAPVKNHLGIVCYECGRPGHFRKDFPKLRNHNRGNQTGKKNGNKTGNQTGGNKATARAYAIGGG
nr:reverse transcriptase domain-containing protein [Tanacetum cinerariifolium]